MIRDSGDSDAGLLRRQEQLRRGYRRYSSQRSGEGLHQFKHVTSLRALRFRFRRTV